MDIQRLALLPQSDQVAYLRTLSRGQLLQLRDRLAPLALAERQAGLASLGSWFSSLFGSVTKIVSGFVGGAGQTVVVPPLAPAPPPVPPAANPSPFANPMVLLGLGLVLVFAMKRR